MIIIKTVAKQTKRGVRVWMEGGKLTQAGWNCGDRFDIEFDDNVILEVVQNTIINGNKDRVVRLIKNPQGKHKVTNGSRNGTPRPIIDLHSKRLEKLFKACTAIKCTLANNLIIVKQDFLYEGRKD